MNNNTTNKKSIIDEIIQKQQEETELDFITNLKSTCNATKDRAISILLTWTKNLEYYDKPFMFSHECGRNINLLRCFIRRMSDTFENFIAKANEINVFKDRETEKVFFISLLKFNQVFDTLKYFVFKAGNPTHYDKMILDFSEKFNSYCKFYRNTFYNYLSVEDKRYIDENSFLKI